MSIPTPILRTDANLPSSDKSNFGGTSIMEQSTPPSTRRTPSFSGQITHALADALCKSTSFAAHYLIEVLRHAALLLRLPLSCAIFIFVLVWLLDCLVSTSLRPAHALLCGLPVMSKLAICLSVATQPDVSRRVTVGKSPVVQMVESQRADVRGSFFDQWLDLSGTIDGGELSFGVWKAQMIASELEAHVRVGDLGSSDNLGDKLSHFETHIGETIWDLQDLTSKIEIVVDCIIAMNDYSSSAAATAGTKPSYLSRNSLASSPPPSPTDVTDFMGDELLHLILSAETTLQALTTHKKQLKALHHIIAKDYASLSSERAALMAEMWTFWGGNREKLHQLDQRLEGSQKLDMDRQKALAYVAGAIRLLQSKLADMKNLNQRAVLLKAMSERLPLEVFSQSIDVGLGRLRAWSFKAEKQGNAPEKAMLINAA